MAIGVFSGVEYFVLQELRMLTIERYLSILQTSGIRSATLSHQHEDVCHPFFFYDRWPCGAVGLWAVGYLRLLHAGLFCDGFGTAPSASQ